MLHTVKQEAVEMKEINIPVGISDFKEICKNGYYYVDKTFLIKELLKTTATKVTLITRPCLLYTSDAADEEDSVDLSGRRIIKKKKQKKTK